MTSPSAAPTVLAGVGADDAHAAVRWAAREASRRGATLRLVRVRRWWQSRTGAARTLDAAARAAAAAAPATAIERTVCVGSPLRSLRAASGRADLVVVGARPRRLIATGGLGWVLGRTAHCPVAVVPAAHAAPDPALPVVVGVDGSPADDAAIAFAFAAAAARDAVLVAAHTWADYVADDGPADLLSWEQIAEEERAVLDEQLARAAGDHPEVVVKRMCPCTSATRLLVELSRRAQVVVIGSHGHGGVAAHLLDATGRGLARAAGCPWVVARTTRAPAASSAAGGRHG